MIERNVLEWRLDPTSDARDHRAAATDTVIVTCQEGYTSSLAAAALQDLGLRATDLAGGFQAWQAAGLPTRGWWPSGRLRLSQPGRGLDVGHPGRVPRGELGDDLGPFRTEVGRLAWIGDQVREPDAVARIGVLRRARSPSAIGDDPSVELSFQRPARNGPGGTRCPSAVRHARYVRDPATVLPLLIRRLRARGRAGPGRRRPRRRMPPHPRQRAATGTGPSS